MDEGKKDVMFDLKRAVLIYYPPVDFRSGGTLPEKIDTACELIDFAKAHEKFYPHLLKWAGSNDPCQVLCQLPLWIVEVRVDELGEVFQESRQTVLLGGLWAEMVDDHTAAIGIIKNPMVGRDQFHEIVKQFGPLVMDYIFRVPGVTRIMAACDMENRGALQLAHKVDLTYYGILKQHIVLGGKPYDYGLFIRVKGDADADHK